MPSQPYRPSSAAGRRAGRPKIHCGTPCSHMSSAWAGPPKQARYGNNGYRSTLASLWLASNLSPIRALWTGMQNTISAYRCSSQYPYRSAIIEPSIRHMFG